MRGTSYRWTRTVVFAAAAVLFVGAAYGQDFGEASLNGVYAFVIENQAEPGMPAPTHGRWVLVSFHGDGTWELTWLGSNVPAADGSREARAGALGLTRSSYRVMPNGAIELLAADGSVAWDGIIVRSELRDGVLVATEYVAYNRLPDDVTGALRMGRGTLQKPLGSGQ